MNDAGTSDDLPQRAEEPDDDTPKTSWVMKEPKEVEAGEEQSSPFGLVVIAGLFAMLWFWAGPRYFLVVFGLLVMIFLHELGHFMTARWTGMKATQFFLFMGPRVFSFRKGETEYGLRLLPLGAFVRIVGMNNLDPCDPEDEPRAYKNKSYPRRMLVITAGSIMHFVQALILFVVLSSIIGEPDPARWNVAEISGLDNGSSPPALKPLESSLAMRSRRSMGSPPPTSVTCRPACGTARARKSPSRSSVATMCVRSMSCSRPGRSRTAPRSDSSASLPVSSVRS